MSPFRPMLFGTPVVVHQGRPRYVLPPDLPLPPDFRAEFEAWAATFFEQRIYLIPDGVTYIANGVFHMNPTTFAQLKAVCDSLEKPL